MAASIVRTQSPKQFAFTIWASRDDIADLDDAIGDDHAVNQQFEQRALSVEIGASQTFAHTLTECLGTGGQASRLALTLSILHQLILLPIQRLQSVISITPTPLVLGQRGRPP
jgi:hypothetical protein